MGHGLAWAVDNGLPLRHERAMQLFRNGQPVRIKHLGPARATATGARPLVFVHGAGLSCEAWGSLPRLCAAGGSPTCAIDLPGHGGSGGPALTTIPAMADWLTGTLCDLRLDRPVLVGHSMGALVALHAASIAPDQVGGLVLIGVGARMPVNPRLLETAQRNPAQAAALIARWAFRDGRPAGTNPTPTPTMRMAARRLLGDAAPGVLATDLAACDVYADAEECAARLDLPCLLVIGAGDRMTPPEAGRALAKAFSHARVTTIPACGHMAMIEAPRRAQATIRSYLKELCP